MKPYQILEVANTHGGNLEYLLSLIDEFTEYKDYGIKFQPLHPDGIATVDYAWYNVYQELLFTSEQWKTIIGKASQTKEIWLDLFDTYGADIFHLYQDNVKGLKLQASVLYNESVLQALEKNGLAGKILIINISGLQLNNITERITSLKERLRPQEIWVEVGFQSFPTLLEDSGLVKIAAIRAITDSKIVFADHADGKGDDTVWLPIMAAMNGADIIEKHIMHTSLETKYDHFSSIDANKYKLYIEKLTAYLSLKEQPFINEREKKYLAGSIQIPVAKKKLPAGSLIDFKTDIEFKRSGQQGLNTLELRELQNGMHILAAGIEAGQAFQKHHFKKATIATIIACRLKSTRLPKKALLKIGDLPSVETCIKSCLRFNNVNYTVLATSDLPDDAELENYTYQPSVIFHTGDPEDVIRRYLSATDKLKADVVIRITADIPYVSQEIVDILLKSHFENGADYTVANNATVGSSSEIINTVSLQKIKDHFPSASYSEYMTWYFQNNPEHFKLNFISLPPALLRNYRLTLDYQEDLDLFNAIQQYLDENKLPPSIDIIFNYLDQHPGIANLNAHLTLKYKTDQTLIDTLNRETKIK